MFLDVSVFDIKDGKIKNHEPCRDLRITKTVPPTKDLHVSKLEKEI